MKAALMFCVVLAVFSLFGCGSATPPMPRIDPDRITQVSVINALMLGEYDGLMPIPELLRQGDFGLGTLDHLDGELTILGGLRVSSPCGR